ncbi:mannitol operon transcriptional antiterminator [Enterococcus sp. PF1-24]|uniref:BglG family transcription antiterminator n=1 Tax=unclassified Enterococcus TaxID=2608891 RepID=UPI002474D6F8|nr:MULTISPECIES: BglG family transcription antiterminator [unclassified Enterococcus]MDH6363747.1 mannitol operon transcriptional antiterminator [Enterococcus sp. PFB1-1]MDH6400703.1 mannitol operon transcriptional antiterminator [Enterococcus sp. PF1-24]
MKDRTFAILKLFIATKYTLDFHVLEEKFHISSRTIRNEIKEINTFLFQKGFPEIENVRKEGYRLKLNIEQKEQLTEFTKETQFPDYLERENRIFDLILAFSLGTKPVYLYQKEQEYMVSKSSMDEDMRRVRAVLQKYGIEVLSIAKRGIVLSGAERSIRTMIYDVINHTVGIINPIQEHFSSVNRNILNQYIPIEMLKKIDQLYNQFVFSVEDNIYRNQLIVFTAVWLSRYLRQDLIASSTWEVVDTPQSDIRDFVNKICEEFEIQPSEIEVKYIVFMLNTFNSRDMHNSIEWVQAQLLAIQLIQFVEYQTKIPFSRKEEMLHEGLYKHIAGLINRVKSDLQIVNPLKENIQKNYESIYLAIREFIPAIEQETGKKISEDEIAFLTIHFSTSVSEINRDLHYVYKAVVICNHGMATGNLLSANLKELFNIEVLAVLSSREIELIDKLDVDLVFTTVKINYDKKPLLELDPIIKEESKKVIQQFLTDNSIYKRLINDSTDVTQLFYSLIEIIEKSQGEMNGEVYQELESVFDKNHLVINKKEIQPMLEDVLKDSAILLNQSVSGWEEAIENVSEPLLKEKTIEKRYVEAMIQTVNEFGPYIVIGKHIALAHARPEDGANKLGVSVATLKEPIEFGNDLNDPVKIIFCLAAVDSYSHLNIMKALVDLINDEEKLNHLSEITDLTEFKAVLFNTVKK